MKPVIAVVGFPRSGTTLMMRMLHAGGVPVIGEPPAYEDDRTNDFYGNELTFLNECGGMAVKLLEPHRLKLPAIPFHFLWCERTPAQQAKSQIKLLRLLAGIPAKESAVPQIARGIMRDTPIVKSALSKRPFCDLMTCSFETTLAFPLTQIRRLSAFLGVELDHKAVAQVQSRRPECLPGLLETTLSEAAP